MAETFVFTVRWKGPELSQDQVEALYEAGLDDCAVETGPAYTLIDCAREAPCYQAAVDSVIAGIARVPGLPGPGWEAVRG